MNLFLQTTAHLHYASAATQDSKLIRSASGKTRVTQTTDHFYASDQVTTLFLLLGLSGPGSDD